MNEDRINFENNNDGGVKYNLPSSVPVEDLMKNKIGIMMLLDNLNSQARRIQRQTEEIEELKCTRISLPLSISLAITNIIGTVLIAIGVNLLTSNTIFYVAIALVVFGGLAVIVACLTPIINRWYLGKENK